MAKIKELDEKIDNLIYENNKLSVFNIIDQS